MRIVSLLPAATEIVYLLGLGSKVVGVSHECDFPEKVSSKPKVTYSKVTNDLSSIQINKIVQSSKHSGFGVFHIEEVLLKELKPDLILTQELCKVCAVGFDQVEQASRILKSDISIISLEPESVEDILQNIKTVGKFTKKLKKAESEIKKLKQRLQKVSSLTKKLSHKPKVLVIEWLNPVMIAGHWVPEMVDVAGGINLISRPGQKSYPIALKDIKDANPEIIIFAVCGFDIKRTLKEKNLIRRIVKASNSSKVYIIDGNSFFTRPGPRIIDGIEILTEVWHPGTFKRRHPESAWQPWSNFPTSFV